MTTRKILVLSVSAGAGHMRAAEAIRACANSLDPDTDAEATHLDVMNYVPSGFRKLYTDFYIKLVNKAPTLWGYLYQVSNEAQADSTMERLRRAIERLNTRALLEEIARFQPDAIICTHFLPAEILSRLIRKKGFSCPVWVQVTDFDLHRLWVHEGMAGYFAANEEVAFRMQAQGIAADKIHVTGIPVMPAFALPLERRACAGEFGLDPHKATVLLMGGGAGLGSLASVAARLLTLGGDFQLIVLAGKNAQALSALQALAVQHPGRLVAQGLWDPLESTCRHASLSIL